ncbi:kinase-like domain-containing protein, partial [Cantharellus anzutake]|uniref:kinase-like domain-containing protein n=1 Tax=Cantharellus anzutake TaxID=1750568 RepID=UPI001908415C
MAQSSRRSSISGPSQHNALVSQNQVVLYNASSKGLTVNYIHPACHTVEEPDASTCPYCHRPLDEYNHSAPQAPTSDHRAPNYFHLLAIHNESTSRPLTPPHLEDEARPPLSSETMAEGYFDAFFREESKLGMGANGSVFLCQHVLDGNLLGRFAVKKIAVGSSHKYLVRILKEVRLLETLRHPNIITYHHSWLEPCRFSTFGPSVPTLFILMQWAEGGSLDDFIAQRRGISHGDTYQNSASPESEEAHMTKAQRIAAFKARTGAGASGTSRPANLKAVHLLSTDEIVSLLWDITSGLAFLHNRSILHLDLKPGNVLLTWDPNVLIPRGMLSDFGAARDMLHQGSRTGVTGTLEYTSPEIIMPDPMTGALRQTDSKSDIWSLGIILHKLIFFHTPWRNGNDDFSLLEQEVIAYPGFIPDPSITSACSRRGLPTELLTLLQSLLDRAPGRRPSCEKILLAIEEHK